MTAGDAMYIAQILSSKAFTASSWNVLIKFLEAVLHKPGLQIANRAINLELCCLAASFQIIPGDSITHRTDTWVRTWCHCQMHMHKTYICICICVYIYTYVHIYIYIHDTMHTYDETTKVFSKAIYSECQTWCMREAPLEDSEPPLSTLSAMQLQHANFSLPSRCKLCVQCQRTWKQHGPHKLPFLESPFEPAGNKHQQLNNLTISCTYRSSWVRTSSWLKVSLCTCTKYQQATNKSSKYIYNNAHLSVHPSIYIYILYIAVSLQRCFQTLPSRAQTDLHSVWAASQEQDPHWTALKKAPLLEPKQTLQCAGHCPALGEDSARLSSWIPDTKHWLMLLSSNHYRSYEYSSLTHELGLSEQHKVCIHMHS